jgi:lipooligosaccharide transport system permease protein
VNICRALATEPSPALLVDLAWILVFTAALSLLPIRFMRKRLIG